MWQAAFDDIATLGLTDTTGTVTWESSEDCDGSLVLCGDEREPNVE